jgi:hypothetical protein
MRDVFERLQAMKDNLETLMQDEVARAEKVKAEKLDLEIRLALANALAALEVAAPYLRHAGPQQQIRGAKEQIRKALAA